MTEFAHDLYLLVAVLGLALCVSYAGQPVLCQGMFVAAGAFGVVHLQRAGVPLIGAALVAAGCAAVLGMIVAALTARVNGAVLALSTWTLAWLADAVLRSFPAVSDGPGGLSLPTPVRLHSGLFDASLTLTPGIHAVVAGVLCLLVVALVAGVQRGRLGLELAAVRAAPQLATSLGVPVAWRRAAVLVAAAMLGSLAGAGTAVLAGVASPGDVSPVLSLQLFAALLIVGRTPRVWAAVAGWAVVAAIPHIATDLTDAAGLPAARLTDLITAAVLVVVVLLRAPIARAAAALTRPVRGPMPMRASVVADPKPGTLTAQGIRVRAGNADLVEDVDLSITTGQIHGLVGANGSGKTTMLRVLDGTIRPTAGRVTWRGEDVTAAGPLAMVRAGVTRTFQRTVELPDLTPYQQVRIAGERPDALELVELADKADVDPRTLTTGELRLLQIARAAATGAALLLLDEPAAGMSSAERALLRRVISRLAERGIGVLLVEHDAALVADVADTITVLDHGHVVTGATRAG